jgi:6-phosphofructokinase 1
MAIAIMTSGGDCAGMNPAIKYFVEHVILHNLEPYLIYDGLKGLIDNNIKKVTLNDVQGIIHLGGTIIVVLVPNDFLSINIENKHIII